MKSIIAVIAIVLATASATAHAMDGLGVGVIVGEPTGLSLKYWLDDEHAIDGAAAWSFWDHDGFQLHADYLWHNFDLIDPDSFSGKLPVYYGVGGRLKLEDDEGRRHDDHTVFGIRVPLGISYLFADAPFDLFAEVVPVLDLTPDVDLDINVAIGLRFYFR